MKHRVILMLLISLVLAGCSQAKPAETQVNNTDPEIKTEVQEEKDKVVIKTEQGKLEVSSDPDKKLEVPEGFPTEKIPVYPNGNIVVSEVFEGGYNIGIVTNDDIKTIHEYYKKNLKLEATISEMVSAESVSLIIQDDKINGAVIAMQNNLENDFKNIIYLTYGEYE